MTAAGQPFIPAEDNEPPVESVLREVRPDGDARVWFRRDGFWLLDGDLTHYRWADVLDRVDAGSVFVLLYIPGAA